MAGIRALAASLALLLLLAPAARAVQITVPPSGDECFQQDVEQANKLSGSFEVLSGGLLDVDCTVTGPSRETHYSTQRQKSGAFSLLAPATGSYSICFSNRRVAARERTRRRPRARGLRAPPTPRFASRFALLALTLFPFAPSAPAARPPARFAGSRRSPRRRWPSRCTRATRSSATWPSRST